jgi:hypothetical protein
MEQKADAEVDRQPRQVEQSDRAGAGEEAADGVKVADRLRAFAPDAERERQADDGVIDAQAQRFVELPTRTRIRLRIASMMPCAA